jgi:hypothetical protein
VPNAQCHVSLWGRCARKRAGGDGNGADRAPRCERSISAQCGRPTPGPRRARCGRGAGVSRDAALAPQIARSRIQPTRPWLVQLADAAGCHHHCEKAAAAAQLRRS